MGKPGPRCTVCASPHRHQIDVGLTHLVPRAALAARFDLGADAIHRHANNHLTPVQRAAILAAMKPSAIDLEALQASESEGLLAQLVTQRARLQRNAEMSADLGDVRGAVSAETAITANLALVGKLVGQLVQRHEVRSTSILVSPDYLRLRAALVDALRPFPDAARAVGAALHQIETEAAATIMPKRAPAVIDHVRTLPPPPC